MEGDKGQVCLNQGMELPLKWCKGKLPGEVLATALAGFLEGVCNQLTCPVEGEDWAPGGVQEVER